MTKTTYLVQYLDHSGIMQQAYAPGADPRAAIQRVAECEPRYLRAVRCVPTR